MATDKRERYRWVQKTLVKHRCLLLGKADWGTVTRYLMKVTGYSLAQTKRLIQDPVDDLLVLDTSDDSDRSAAAAADFSATSLLQVDRWHTPPLPHDRDAQRRSSSSQSPACAPLCGPPVAGWAGGRPYPAPLLEDSRLSLWAALIQPLKSLIVLKKCDSHCMSTRPVLAR